VPFKSSSDLRVLGLQDPRLSERLQAAAKAAGLDSVEQLADLMIDSGVATIPPSSELSPALTLEDLGKRLWSEAHATPKHARATWFAGLSPTQRTSLVVVLRNRGYSSMTIAQDFGISVHSVAKAWSEHATRMGEQVLSVRLDTLVGQIQLAAEQAAQMAAEKNDAAAFFRVQQGLIRMLQDLGVVEKAAHRVEVTHKSADEKQALIKQLLRTEQQKIVRGEEIKRAEVEVAEGEALPENVKDAYEGLQP
jgi:predicted transcriptional regulator